MLGGCASHLHAPGAVAGALLGRREGHVVAVVPPEIRVRVAGKRRVVRAARQHDLIKGKLEIFDLLRVPDEKQAVGGAVLIRDERERSRRDLLVKAPCFELLSCG